MRIELTPTLTHCIESAARDAYSGSLDQYIEQARDDKELEERIELLRLFLESMDFRELRRESEKHMTDGKTVRFLVYLEGRKPKYELRVDR